MSTAQAHFLLDKYLRVLSVMVGVSLLLGIPYGWPYFYYVFLRWAVCGASLVLIWKFYQSSLFSWMLIFGAIAFLFNPLYPINLQKESWVAIDVISSMLFFLVPFTFKKGE